jgi:hypothetical protein
MWSVEEEELLVDTKSKLLEEKDNRHTPESRAGLGNPKNQPSVLTIPCQENSTFTMNPMLL